MEGKTFECPNCGGAVSYDPNLGKLICSSCKTIYRIPLHKNWILPDMGLIH